MTLIQSSPYVITPVVHYCDDGFFLLFDIIVTYGFDIGGWTTVLCHKGRSAIYVCLGTRRRLFGGSGERAVLKKVNEIWRTAQKH